MATICGQSAQSLNLRASTGPPFAAAAKAPWRRRPDTVPAAGDAAGPATGASPVEAVERVPAGRRVESTESEITVGAGAGAPLQPAKQKSAPVRPEL